MVARNRHRPRSVAALELNEKARCVVDVPARIQHVAQARKFGRVVVMVDLHAAQIDELDAGAACLLEGTNGVFPVAREYRAALDIEGVRMQATLLSGLRKPHGIKDSGGNPVPVGRAQDLGLAGIRCRRDGRKSEKARYRGCCQRDPQTLRQGRGLLFRRRVHWCSDRRFVPCRLLHPAPAGSG